MEETEKKNHRGLGCRISVSGLRSTNLVFSAVVVPPDPPGEIVCSQLCFLQLLGITDFQGRKDGRVQPGSSPASSLIRRECENFRTIAKRSKTKQIFHRSQLMFFVAEYLFIL